MQIVLFEDDAVRDLAPVTTGRPTYAVSCASYRLIDWVRTLNLPTYGAVRSHLLDIQKLDYDLKSPTADSLATGPLLALNARLVPSVDLVGVIQTLISEGRTAAIHADSGIAAAYYTNIPPQFATDTFSLSSQIRTTAQALPSVEKTVPMFCWPHDIVSENMRLLNSSLEHRLAGGGYKEVQDGVFLAEGAEIGQYAVIDTSHGPIVLDKNVKVGPFCYLSGPVYAGPNTRVIEHAALKDAVSLGHTVKIGGEVEASVIEPYSNKQHHGFLGHSYLGSWINLGAGTCNSDLKNTYGAINMQYGASRVPTGMQFMGCIMGDYTKTAINTGIFTGKVVGVCSMLYGFVTSNVPSFVNYARLFGQTAELPPDVMVATQQRMFARRKVTQRACDQQLIQDMHRLTEMEREGQLGAL
jgi:UDP-N-acetylglucosamine diphosphorylase / glucose-1-phosphate thymidylyltransferase / UDP-N-acetylgalactosamine diphosphorylase / glucosamine-1-phosphate N-acetyltransferase / galactosamine-1-phosphate N-acetyltransferase